MAQLSKLERDILWQLFHFWFDNSDARWRDLKDNCWICNEHSSLMQNLICAIFDLPRVPLTTDNARHFLTVAAHFMVGSRTTSPYSTCSRVPVL